MAPTPHPDASARPATRDDLVHLAKLRAEARFTVSDARGGRSLIDKDHPEHAGSSLLGAAMDGASDVLALVGMIDEAVVGFALALHEMTEASDRVATLTEFWVTPEAREMGVGEELIGAVLTWAESVGCRALDADALPGDRSTKNFFERYGLVARGIRVQRRFDGSAS